MHRRTSQVIDLNPFSTPTFNQVAFMETQIEGVACESILVPFSRLLHEITQMMSKFHCPVSYLLTACYCRIQEFIKVRNKKTIWVFHCENLTKNYFPISCGSSHLTPQSISVCRRPTEFSFENGQDKSYGIKVEWLRSTKCSLVRWVWAECGWIFWLTLTDNRVILCVSDYPPCERRYAQVVARVRDGLQ